MRRVLPERVPPRRPSAPTTRGVCGAIAVALLATLASGCAPRPVAAPPSPAVALPVPPPRAIPTSNPTLVRELTRRGLDAREVAEGVVVYLPTVYLFAFDRAEIEAAATSQLREIAAMVNEAPLAGRRIVVEGHADGVGGRDYNMELSERRADAVIAALVEAGVSRARLTRRAFGPDRPIEPNRRPDGGDNPEGRARNRRVALLIENPLK